MRGRRSMWAPVAGALLVAALAPGIAEAQLFPNLPARKRERIDCSQELPVYGLYRHKYYGYYPTCWRQFPPGWGCPTPESPDWEAELAKRPLDIPEDGGMGLGGPGAGLGPDPFGGTGGDDLLPGLPPRERSPFELDPPGAGASPFDPPRGGAGSPFDTDPFSPNPPGGPGVAPPERTTPPSPFDLPGASNSPGDLPSLAPPVTGASQPRDGEPVTSAAGPSGLPELAVIPEVRPRPIRLPSYESGSLDGPRGVSMSSAPAGIGPGPFPPANSFPGDLPGVIDPGAQGIIISEPGAFEPGSVIMGAPEERPRRRILSGLFNRRN